MYIFESIPDALLVIDYEGNIKRVNGQAEAMFGYSRTELLGQPVETLIPRRLAVRHVEHRSGYVAIPNMWPMGAQLELRVRRKDDTEVPVDVMLNPLKTDEGPFILCVVRDITERNRAEVKFRSLLESAPDAMVIVDKRGHIVLVNAQTEQLFGYSRQELLGQAVEVLVPVPLRDRHVEHRTHFYIRPHTRPMGSGISLLGVRKDGSEFPVEISLSPLETAEGTLVTAAIRDISERRRAEKEREKLEASLRQAQKLESLGVLAGGIAHDFNNLLTSILGYSDLAKLELPPGSASHNFIDEVIKGSRRAAELTQQMLAYSGKGRFVVQPLSLSALVEDMGRLLEISISKKCVLRYHFTPDLPACEADMAQVRQIIMNLIINASEAIGERSGVISVSTGVMHCDRAYLSATYIDVQLPEGLYVYLEVADNGRGMSQETLAKLFDPFFTTKATGRGLGLAAVLGIVRGHHGAIKVYSELNQGTSFKVLFPATTGVVPMGLPQTETTAWRGSGTVLVVDDEESVRGVARHMMEKMGFSVLTAADGRAGVEVFGNESERIRLVILDMTMPHLDGEETFREMRRIRGGVPTILCSGYNEQSATNRFAGKGLAAFIQKPFQYEQLVTVVRKALGQDGGPNQSLHHAAPA